MRRPKFKEECPEASIRGGPEELTLRAEEVGSRNRASILTTLGKTDGDRPWLTLIGMPLAKLSTRELKAANGRICTSTKEMRKAAGVRKPHES